jgi:hypothetical protein
MVMSIQGILLAEIDLREQATLHGRQHSTHKTYCFCIFFSS